MICNASSIVMLLVTLVFHQLEGIACPDDDFGINEPNFITLENEQKELSQKIPMLRAQIEMQDENSKKTSQFIALVEKYTNLQELTPSIANEFIEKIIVHAPDKSSGNRTQAIHIQYNFVGILPTL